MYTSVELTTLVNPVRSAAADCGHEKRRTGSTDDKAKPVRYPRLPGELKQKKTGRDRDKKGSDQPGGEAGLSQAEKRPARAPQERRRHRYIPVML